MTAGLLSFFREGRPDSDYRSGTGYHIATTRPRIVCVDGFSLSVQAGELLYCSPETDPGPWRTVEVGYPSARPEPWAKWSKFAESPDRPDDTVYGYVPLPLVEALVASHGGEMPA